jgi:hypothetical protein
MAWRIRRSRIFEYRVVDLSTMRVQRDRKPDSENSSS